MSAGYLYVLQNKAFGANVVKIGLTTRTPDVRAREIYAGASGVPLPFDIAVAYSVADCSKAEKLAHRRLKTYRLSNRREFFRLSPSVASSVVHAVCAEVNNEMGAQTPLQFGFPSLSSAAKIVDTVLNTDSDGSDGRAVIQLEIARLRESPAGTSLLTEEQFDRAHILYEVLTKVNPVARGRWLEGFTRDDPPERELRIWEHIAKAYLTLDHADEAPNGYRSEAFELLLKRTWSSTPEALSSTTLKYFSRASAKRLLDAYELKPKPLLIAQGISAV